MRVRPTTCFALLLALLCGNGHAESIQAVTEETSYSYLQDGQVGGPASRVVEAMLQRAGLTDYSLAQRALQSAGAKREAFEAAV